MIRRFIFRKEGSLSQFSVGYFTIRSFSVFPKASINALPRGHSRSTLWPRKPHQTAIHQTGAFASVQTSATKAKMSDSEADPELLDLLRQHLQGNLNLDEEPETGVLDGAEYVYDNSIDVALDMRATKNAAAFIYDQMQQKQYSTETWAEHELHPKTKDEATVAFIFTMDLLNFSFWSLRSEDERFAVSYRDKTWTGYWSLVASLQRALEEGRSSAAVQTTSLCAT